jgi:LmbE family N-acetylglucosaminyl deacetylase
VRLIRETRPDILITQDPEHSYADLDPDRRLLMLLYLEAASLAGRDWRIEECGGFERHLIRDLYYMSPHNPNCVVEIGSTFALKQQALGVLEGQMAFTAQVLRSRLNPESLETIVPGYAHLSDLELGRSLHREMDKSSALYHGLLSHAGATMAEAFRHQFPFRLERLL